MHDSRDIVLTGPPRSGTTLSCYLLGKLPNTVALNEPVRPAHFAPLKKDPVALADALTQWFRRTRTRIETERRAPSKHVGGRLSYETYGPPKQGGGRDEALESGEIILKKPLDDRFFLVAKSPGVFTAMLPVLGGRFNCHAVVRNPLAVLASVQSVNPDLSSTKNVAPGAQMLDEDFARDLSEMPLDPLGWLLRLLSWSFERYARFLSPENVIRYEDVVASGGRALSEIIPAAGELDEPLENKNLNEFYDPHETRRAGERLLSSEGAYWRFYSREEVEDLLARL